MIFADNGRLSFSAFDSFEPVRDLWAALCEVAEPAPLQSLTYLETWWETVGRERYEAMRLVVAGDAAGPFAILPLVLGRYHTVRYVEWMGDADQLWRGPLVARDVMAGLSPAAALRLVDGAAASLGEPIDALLLRDMPAAFNGLDNPFVGPDAVATGAGHLRFDLAVAQPAPGTAQLADRLGALGPVTFEAAGDRDERGYLFSIFAEQTSAVAAKHHRADPLAGAGLSFLHRLAMGEASATVDGTGSFLAGLFVGDRPAGVFFALTAGDHAVAIGASRSLDRDMQHAAPGRLVAQLALEQLGRAGFSTLDMPLVGATSAGLPAGAALVPHGHLFRQQTTLGYLLCAGERTLARVKASYHEPVRQRRVEEAAREERAA